MKTYITILFVALATIGFSQKRDLNPVKWSFDSNQVGPDEYVLIFKAEYKSPWVVYSKDNGEDGPVPTTINFTSDNVEKIGDAEEIGNKVKKNDSLFDMSVIKFEAGTPFVTKQRVRLKDNTKPIKGYVNFMTCNNEICLPPKDENFSFTFKVLPPKNMAPGKKSIPIKNF